MEVVAGESRLFAARRDKGPHVGLVGGLVCREACVAGDPVGAVLRAQPPDRRVEGRNAGDQPFGEGGETTLRAGPFVAVGVEPFAVVVVVQPVQESENLLHVVRVSGSYHAKSG